jgi:hypothetical protein
LDAEQAIVAPDGDEMSSTTETLEVSPEPELLTVATTVPLPQRSPDAQSVRVELTLTPDSVAARAGAATSSTPNTAAAIRRRYLHGTGGELVWGIRLVSTRGDMWTVRLESGGRASGASGRYFSSHI